MLTSNLLHILSTDYLAGDEVLVRLSDGTTAVFELDELEKLRPHRKEIVHDRKRA